MKAMKEFIFYVGNLHGKIYEHQLGAIFGAYGNVNAVAMVDSAFNGFLRGSAIVYMENEAQAKEAIGELQATTRWDFEYPEEGWQEYDYCQCCGSNRPRHSWDLCLSCAHMRCRLCGQKVEPVERGQVCLWCMNLRP
jgi:RNA recognition motif-containing protein